jgi:DNA modification methylase
MKYPEDFVDKIILGDCLEVMSKIPEHCIDLILCDLPYQVTQNGWDQIIPMEPLWEQYSRLIKPNGAIVLTAQGKFSAMLIMAAKVKYQYSAVWVKNNHTNQLNAKKQLLRQHEDILIFYDNQPTYNPQGIVKVEKVTVQGKKSTTCYGVHSREDYLQEYSNWPTTLIQVKGKTTGIHPTEKPVNLFSYLCKTFSNEGDLVLDNCSGSGTTAVMAKSIDRHFICIENDPEMHAKSVERFNKEFQNDGLFG